MTPGATTAMSASDDTASIAPGSSGAERQLPVMTRVVIRLVILALALVILVFFIAGNFVVVDVRVFGVYVSRRLAWVILLSFLSGAVVGGTIVAIRWQLWRRQR